MKPLELGFAFLALAGLKALGENHQYLQGMRIIPMADGENLLLSIDVEGGPPALMVASLPPNTTIADMQREEWFAALVDTDLLMAMDVEGNA